MPIRIIIGSDIHDYRTKIKIVNGDKFVHYFCDQGILATVRDLTIAEQIALRDLLIQSIKEELPDA